jgi:hypothetical protein
MALYTLSVDGIALVAATAKTIAELGVAASDRAKIVEWSLTFDGVTSTAIPVKVEVGRFSAGVTTATTLAGFKGDAGDGTAAVVAKHSTTVEGAGTATDVLLYRVPPTGGLVIQAPLGREMVLAVSTFWRIRCTAAAGVNATFTCTWEE